MPTVLPRSGIGEKSVPTESQPLGYLWAAILGIIQGVAEFLPISSSGHLALAEHIGMGVAVPPVFDVFLHLATLVVVVLYFRRSLAWYYRNDRIVLLYVIIATIPTGIIGVVAKDYFEALRLSPTMICIGLLVTACALSLAELGKGATYQLRDLGWFGAFFIGLCQALAITPGVSRSGATISGAILCGMDKEEAFRFSFILSIPAVLGAIGLHAPHLLKDGEARQLVQVLPIGPSIVGFVCALVTGYVALLLLERIVVAGKLVWFAAYCCLAAIAGLIYFNIYS